MGKEKIEKTKTGRERRKAVLSLTPEAFRRLKIESATQDVTMSAIAEGLIMRYCAQGVALPA